MSGPLALEIAVTSAAGASIARDGGADRVELCSALELGGVTPSQGLVEAVVATGIAAHVLVRARPGGFVYDADELDTMVREVRAIARAGAAGVVVGALDDAGALDVEAIARFGGAAREISPDMEVTVHRAIDRAADPVAAARSLAGLGVTRVLSSGGAPAAPLGVAVLARMVPAAGEVQVMAGAGVTAAAVPVLAATGVAAVHLSAKRRAPAAPGADGAAFVPMGDTDDDVTFVTDAAVVAEAWSAVDAWRREHS